MIMRNNNSLLEEENSSHMLGRIMREITTEMMGLINHIDSHHFLITIRIHIMEILIHQEIMIIKIIIIIRATRIRDTKIIIIMMKMIVTIIDLIIRKTTSVKDLAPRGKVSQMLSHRMFLRKGSAHQ